MSNPLNKQAKIFLESEGDEFYNRISKANSFENIHPLRKLLLNWCSSRVDYISKVLEIGAGDGSQLAYLADGLNAKAVGIEPSAKAVEKWENRRHIIKGGDKTTLQVGVANKLPFNEDEFDFVIFGHCLYLLDRKDIYYSIAEADRVLKDGGLISIIDFDPLSPYANPYTHKEGIYSYKNDYSKIFLASGHYSLMHKYSFSHSKFSFNENNDERLSLSLLFKQENYIYYQK